MREAQPVEVGVSGGARREGLGDGGVRTSTLQQRPPRVGIDIAGSHIGREEKGGGGGVGLGGGGLGGGQAQGER